MGFVIINLLWCYLIHKITFNDTALLNEYSHKICFQNLYNNTCMHTL